MVAGLTRNELLIKFFVQACPQRLARTQLVKLIYMADHEARRYLGAPMSEFEWTRQPQGPFDQAFYTAKDRLVAQGLISEAVGSTPFGNPWYLYQDRGHMVDFNFSPAERRILEYIVRAYGRCTREKILADVYETAPFKAVEEEPRHTRLPMEIVDNVKRDQFGGVDLGRLIEAEARFKRGEGVPGEQIKQALRKAAEG